MDSTPVLSIVMAVRNGSETVARAIQSVLNQTFTNFEFIIINDGSTDATYEIVSKFSDQRIILLTNKECIGLPAALNIAINKSMGSYIGRMDADDQCLPDRFENQIHFLETNKDIGVCGTWVRATFNNNKSSIWKYPFNHEDIRAQLLFESCLSHPTIVFRRSAFLSTSLMYNEHYLRAQDYEFWTRIIGKVKFGVVQKTLLLYSVNNTNKESISNQQLIQIRQRYLESTGFDLTTQEKYFHSQMCDLRRSDATIEILYESELYLTKLIHQNNNKLFFANNAFNTAVAGRWFKVCNAGIYIGIKCVILYFKSPLRIKKKPTFNEIKLIVRCLLKK